MSGKNKVTVRIAGVAYVLTSDESNDYMQRMALYVDRKISDSLEANEKLGSTAATALAALKIADELYKSQGNNKMLKETLERVCDDLEKARKEIALLKSNGEKGQFEIKT